MIMDKTTREQGDFLFNDFVNLVHYWQFDTDVTLCKNGLLLLKRFLHGYFQSRTKCFFLKKMEKTQWDDWIHTATDHCHRRRGHPCQFVTALIILNRHYPQAIPT